MKTREFAIVCFVALFLTGLVSPIAAEKGDKQLRFGVLYSMPTDDLVVGDQTTELDDAVGLYASFEFQVSDLIGIEPGISSVGYDLTVEQSPFLDENGDTDLLALTANINFHFEKDSGLDLFFGPTIGYAFWDDIETDNFTPDPTDDEFLFGVNFGLDYPFGEGAWAFNAGLSYLSFNIAATNDDIGVSPIELKVGLTYSF